MREVKLKSPSDFDFNKTSGHYHFTYDGLRKDLGLKRIFTIIDKYDFYGVHKINLKDSKGIYFNDLNMSSFKIV